MAILNAISSSARQLYILLRCIGFADKAHVHITENGLRFAVDESRVMQGTALLDKDLFTTYTFSPAESDLDKDGEVPGFQVSIPAILETLQIFGFADSAKDRWSSRDAYTSGVDNLVARGGSTAAFDNRTLGMVGICRFSYDGPGKPLCVTMEEGNVSTTCELVTYEPDADLDDIPFDRERLAQKIIMQADLLCDAIGELEATRPDKMTITTSPNAPNFSLSAAGDHGSTEVVFSKDTQLLETFRVGGTVSNSYKFSLINAAMRAMSSAAKVSIRGDAQGVLSLQFLIETEAGGMSFVDFAFVPLLNDAEDDGDESASFEGAASVPDLDA